MNKKSAAIIAAVILAVVGFFVFTKPAPEVSGELSNHTAGNGSTGVVLIEYGDFQCPACASYFPVLREVKEKYKDLITFQFRHFPLESIHKNARAAARAAEAAAAQGKFWEMHDKLYETQTAWQDSSDPLSIFEGYASVIEVPDLEKFKTDMRSSAINAIITADLTEGRRINITSTPTFVLDGQVLQENPSPTLDSFSKVLDAKIEEKTGQKPVFEDAATEQ